MVGFKSDLRIRMSAAEIVFETALFIRRGERGTKYAILGQHFKDNFRSGHPSAEIGLEPDHRKDTAIWCELTFWAVEFLHIIENMKKGE